jgi:hypothetical protein
VMVATSSKVAVVTVAARRLAAILVVVTIKSTLQSPTRA